MDIIEIAADEAEDLKLELSREGLSFTIGKEDRYFGDADTVSIVIDTIRAATAILSALIAYLSSRKRKTLIINGIEIKVSQPLTDADKEAIKQALNQ